MSDARDRDGQPVVLAPAEELSELVRGATSAMQLDQLDTAGAKLQRVLELDPEHDQGRNLLGLLRYRAGDLAEAERIFLALLQENPGEVALSLNLARVYLKAERTRDAHEVLRRVVEQHPGQPNARELLTRVEIMLGLTRTDLDVMMPDAPPGASPEAAGEVMPTPAAPRAEGLDESQIKAAALAALRARTLRSEEPGPNGDAAEAARRASREFAFEDNDRLEGPVVDGVGEGDLPEPPPADPRSGTEAAYLDPFADDEMFVEELLDNITTEATPVEPVPVAAALVTQLEAPVGSEPGSGHHEEPEAFADQSAEINLDLELVAHEELLEGVDEVGAEAPTPDGPVPATPTLGKEIVLDGQLDEVLVAVMAAVRSQGLSPRAGARADDESPGGRPLGTVIELTPLKALPRDEPEGDVPALVDDDVLLWPVREVGYLRSGSLLGLRGTFELEPVPRRYRGKRTDSPFGGNEGAFVVALGDGVAWLDAASRGARVLDLDADELYLLERAVLAFSGGLVWDNGRLPEEGHSDLDIVHLSGTGRVALREAQRLRAIAVQGTPCVVDTARLVGWTGALTPTRTSLPSLLVHSPRRSLVRLEGDGMVLLG